MKYYLYQITNLTNSKIYIGVHKTDNLNDGYMGSGKVISQAIKKHGLENFRKDILEFFENEELMYAREKEIVTDEFLLREDTYNLRRGGTGGFDYINKNGIEKFKGKKHSEETKLKISSTNKGRSLSEEAKLKIKENNKKTNKSRGEKVRDALSNKPKLNEHKEKISISLSKWCWVKKDGVRKKILKSNLEDAINSGFLPCKR